MNQKKFGFFKPMTLSILFALGLNITPFTQAAESKYDIAFVIDDTQSMAEELKSIVTALTYFINTLKQKIQQGKTPPLIELITFKDAVTIQLVTNDMDLLLKKVQQLTAAGGNKCPEASVEALTTAITHLKPGGRIFFATDASPHPTANMVEVKKGLLEKKISMNALLTGDCQSENQGQ
jgi:hypothetical protein